MPTLPVELWQAIVDNVESRSDLLSLVFVSIILNLIAERRLYHTISFSHSQPYPPYNLAIKKWSVFERISTCPRVASYVLHLIIELHYWPVPSASRFAQVFPSLLNLKSLRIYPSLAIATHLQPHVPFLLHTFHYSGSDPDFVPILGSFLEAQVGLKELVLNSVDPINLTMAALPALTTILGTGKFIRAIVPGRPIRRVAILAEDPIPLPFPSGSHIRSLCISSTSDFLRYTTLFRTLIFLQCPVFKSDAFILVSYIKCFLVLEKLLVITQGCRNRWMDRETLEFVRQIFDADCPSLSSIEIVDRSNLISTMWTRGSQTAIDSSWDREEWRKI